MEVNQPRNRDLITKVAWLYYFGDLTQLEIARKLHLSRPKVGRLLKKAREEGIVEIRLSESVPSYNIMLEEKLEKVFGLSEAIVVDSSVNPDNQRGDLGKASAQYLDRILYDDYQIAVGLGRTLTAMVPFVTRQSSKNGVLRSASGGYISPGHDATEYHAVWALAELISAKVEQLQTPLYVSTPAIRDALMQDVNVIAQMEKSRQCKIAFIGIGYVREDMPIVELEYCDESAAQRLHTTGAVGEIMGSFFNINGEKVATEFDDRVIALGLADLEQIPNVVAVAGGLDKADAIRAALKIGVINTMITDSKTAEKILEKQVGKEL